MIKKGANYISQNQREAISLAQKGVKDGPLSLVQRDKISAGAALATINGKHQCRAEYDGIKMQAVEEALFAIWCDRNNIKWKYQSVIFELGDGLRYVPDFLLIESNEFVEVSVSSLRTRNKTKLDAFVLAGNTLHYVNSHSFCGKIDKSTLYVA